MDSNSFKKDVGETALSQLGYLTKDINLYTLFEGMGKSDAGKEMDKMGRYLFNHRFGGGHLWWKELANRPIEQWPDVLEHLLSDFFTKAGLPYAFDGTMINNPDLFKIFGGGKNISSYNNWAMINGFQFISGASSIIFSVYDATSLSKGYTSDMSLAYDGTFLALNLFGGIATTNPFLIISSVIQTATILRKSQMQLGVETSSPFDLDIDSMLGLGYSFDLDVEGLFKNAQRFDFMCNNKYISYDYV